MFLSSKTPPPGTLAARACPEKVAGFFDKDMLHSEFERFPFRSRDFT
jgi:hypothetical protein